jgi:nicotinamide phosphoribosyltransferase
MKNAALVIDFYKADHRRQYPVGTQEVYSNFTPRSAKLAPVGCDDGVVVFGIQSFVYQFLVGYWLQNFFWKDKREVVRSFKRRMDSSLGPDSVPTDHIEALHDLGYLPIEVKALPEGTLCPLKVPMLTIRNTLPEFFWLTNSLESVMSNMLWKPITSATIARAYRKKFNYYAELTGFDPALVQYQGHDFSFRGLSGLDDAEVTGAGHLLSFVGTDNVPAIDLLEAFYGADSDKEVIGVSVPATEHSVMCMGSQEGELETFERLITEVYPSGFVSIVSDTWDYWKVITEYLPQLKDKVMARNGRVVIRPDSGDPVKIICGDPDAPLDTPEYKGTVECLWETFGGETVKGTGGNFKLLDPHIGLIYGDSITLQRQDEILRRLALKGFCSGNVVLGIGSFTYQYNTRDTFGMAMKATSGVVNGERREIFKDPKTDSGQKKSARGLLKVSFEEGVLTLTDRVSEQEEKEGELKTVFLNGEPKNFQTLDQIRTLLKNQ